MEARRRRSATHIPRAGRAQDPTAEQSPTKIDRTSVLVVRERSPAALGGLLEFFDHPIGADLEPPFLLT
jgi:hypothetical protein